MTALGDEGNGNELKKWVKERLLSRDPWKAPRLSKQIIFISSLAVLCLSLISIRWRGREKKKRGHQPHFRGHTQSMSLEGEPKNHDFLSDIFFHDLEDRPWGGGALSTLERTARSRKNFYAQAHTIHKLYAKIFDLSVRTSLACSPLRATYKSE